MKSAMLMSFLALLLGSCATTPPDGESSVVRRVPFSCTNGEALEVRFFSLQGVAVLVRNGTPIELQQQPSGSGFIYSNGPNTIRGKGEDLTVEIGRMVPIQCSSR